MGVRVCMYVCAFDNYGEGEKKRDGERECKEPKVKTEKWNSTARS